VPVDIAISDALVLTVDEQNRLYEHGTVLIDDGRITGIRSAADEDESVRAAHTIDGNGKLVMPGLINAHTHLEFTPLIGAFSEFDLPELMGSMTTLFNRLGKGEFDYLIEAGYELAALNFLLGGVTTVNSMDVRPSTGAETFGMAGLRGLFGPTLIDLFWDVPVDEQFDRAREFINHYHDTYNGRIRATICPHDDWSCTRELWERTAALASEYPDLLVHTHLLELEESNTMARANGADDSLALLEDIGLLDDRLIAAHFRVADDRDIERTAEADVSIAHCPSVFAYWNPDAEMQWTPISELQASGVDVGLGIDDHYWHDSYDLFGEARQARLAANLKRKTGQYDSMELVRMLTIEGAHALGIGDEIGNTMGGLDGRCVPPGPSGTPTRGRLDTLPTGRNFYAVDSRAVPTPTAWELGQASAEQLVARHLQEHGDYPREIGLSVWGTATMRTGGDDIAQAFALMGIRPVWAPGSNRVVDFEIMPGFKLGRPRVDVTLRVSGFFRDAFANVMRLFDAAVQRLADFEEPGDTNTIRGHVDKRAQALAEQGVSRDEARRQAGFRVFGSRPGAYGAGLKGPIDERTWDDGDDLARAYMDWGAYAYGQETWGEAAGEAFGDRLGRIEAVVQNQDNREHDLLDSDDYYQFQGGMANAARHQRGDGDGPAIYHSDHSNPAAPQVRTLKEELNRVVRSRVTNPKWIAAMQRHGYKGAFEMAASVDFLFAYDATTALVDDYQYEHVSDALVHDEANQQFLREHNPRALQDMSERLVEAMQRGLWAEPGEYRERTESLLLELDEGRERGE